MTSSNQAILAHATDSPISLPRYASAIAAAVVANVIIFWISDAAGATLELDAPYTLNTPTVAAFTAAILAVSGAGLWAISTRKPSVMRWAPWAGLAFAAITAVMPFVASPDTPTATALAVMHLTTGTAWLAGTRQP